MLEMVTFLTTRHVNIEAYAMHVTSNHTLNSEPLEVQCGGFKGQKRKFLVKKVKNLLHCSKLCCA